jgi:hypothetical protein
VLEGGAMFREYAGTAKFNRLELKLWTHCYGYVT